MKNKNFDPAGIIDLDELNEISEVSGGLVIQGTAAVTMVATTTIMAATIATVGITARFSCGGIGCNCECPPEQ